MKCWINKIVAKWKESGTFWEPFPNLKHIHTWYSHTIDICVLYEIQHSNNIGNLCGCNIFPFPSKQKTSSS